MVPVRVSVPAPVLVRAPVPDIAPAYVPALACANSTAALFTIAPCTDDVVPVTENTGLIESRYQALGGRIQVIHKPGVGHHPHGLDDPAPVVTFIRESFRDRKP